MKKPSFTKLKRWQHVLHTDSGRQYFDFETFVSLLDTEGYKFSFMKGISDNAARIWTFKAECGRSRLNGNR